MTQLNPSARRVARPGKTHLRKGKTLHSSECVGKACNKEPCEHQGQRRRGRKCSRARTDVPLQSLERTEVEQLFPPTSCRPWKNTLEQISTLHLTEDHPHLTNLIAFYDDMTS